MAVFKNDPFPGTDYSQYLSWKKITTPGGQTFYVVPGNEGYVYDPVASNATGRKVFRANPEASLKDQQEQEDFAKKQAKQAAFAASPAGQLIPVAGTVGGLVLANKLMTPGASPLETALASQAAAGATGAGTAGATTVATPEVVSINGAAPVEAGLGVAPYLGAAGAGLGAYGVYNAIQNNNKGAGALSGAGLGLGLGAAAPLVGFGPLGWGTLAAMGAAGALGGFGLTSIFGHESTRDVAKKHTSELLDKSDDPTYQNYVSAMREQHNSAPPDPSKPFHGGQYSSWDEYKAAGLDSKDLTGVYGNIKTYGPEWANLTQAQREAVTQANIDSGLYKSNKGEVEITDQAKARENFDNVIKGFNVGANSQAAAQGALLVNGPQVVVPPGAMPNLRSNPVVVRR